MTLWNEQQEAYILSLNRLGVMSKRGHSIIPSKNVRKAEITVLRALIFQREDMQDAVAR